MDVVRLRSESVRGATLRRRSIAVAFMVLVVATHRSDAAGLEDLVSPGPLIAIHAKETKQCGDCHEAFDRTSQAKLCLACHEDVRGDMDAGKGLHGRIGSAGKSECRLCHTEHTGADADIVGLDPESFDHRRTGFALEGGHVAAACGDCHERGKQYREVVSTCVGCHRTDDVHEGALGEDCAKCHSPADWRESSFDHARTRFALRGHHADASCASCHPLLRFADAPLACNACHAADDVHAGRLGTDCAKCHDAGGWTKSGFDHGRETHFALRGRHASLDCKSCHRKDPKEEKLSTACVSCHRTDDVHDGLRGTRCQDCHGSDAWLPSSFDHGRDAKLVLHGAHSELACQLCHVGPMGDRDVPKRCVECHHLVDVHGGSLGRTCENCHGERSWSERKAFDHDLTDFPLLALHQLVSCEDCHATARFGETSTACVACHSGDDAHGRRLGNGCEACHNPNGWGHWLFDHATRTRFALTGRHAALGCVDCHVKPVAADASGGDLGLSMRCDGCHLQDSPHDDAFGRDCERCHVDTSWKQIERR